MSYTAIIGPTIAGRPPGYPVYYRDVRSKSTTSRKRPQNPLANPTSYTAYHRTVRTDPDFISGEIAQPYFGEVAINESAYWEINAMKSALASQADARALTKIKNEKWSLGTFLGELPETQKYLKTVIPRIVNCYVAMKRKALDPRFWRNLVRRGKRFMKKRKLRGTRGGTGDMAQLWLEFRYAVSPMVYDYQDALNYLYDSALRMPIFRVSSGATDKWARVIRDPNGYNFAAFSAVQVRTTCYYSARAESDALKRLGLINLPAVLWELTPLSFVVDMVLPVGDFIGNFDAMVGVNVVSTTRSTKSTLEEVRLPFVRSKTLHGGSSGRGSFYSRSVIGAPVNHPRFSKSATGQQLCDIVALMRTIVFK